MDDSMDEGSPGLQSGESDPGEYEGEFEGDFKGDVEDEYFGDDLDYEASEQENEDDYEEGLPFETDQDSSDEDDDDEEYNLEDFVDPEYLQDAPDVDVPEEAPQPDREDSQSVSGAGTDGSLGFDFDAANLVTTDTGGSGADEDDLGDSSDRDTVGLGEDGEDEHLQELGAARAYEELASRKRGAKEQRAAKVRELAKDIGDELDMNLDHIWQSEAAENMGIAPRKARTGKRDRRREKWREMNPTRYRRWRGEPPMELKKLMGQAYSAFTDGRYDVAKELAHEALKMDHNYPDPYHVIGEICLLKDEKERATGFFFLEANLREKDLAAWERVAGLACETRQPNIAIPALSAAAKLEPNFERHMLAGDAQAQQGHTRKALHHFDAALAFEPGNSEAVRMAARLHYNLGNIEMAKKVLEEQIANFNEQAEGAHVNMLAEIYMSECSWEKAFCLLHEWEKSTPSEQHFPPDLRIKLGQCALEVGQLEDAEKHFQAILLESPDFCADLMKKAGDIYMSINMPHQAIHFYTKLQTVPDENGPELWAKIVDCKAAMGFENAQTDVYRAIFDDEGVAPHEREAAALSLAEEYLRKGDKASACRILGDVAGKFGLPDVVGVSDMAAVYRRANLVHAVDDQEAYLDLIMPLLNHVLQGRMSILQGSQSMSHKIEELVRSRRWKAQPPEPSDSVDSTHPGLFRSKDMDTAHQKRGVDAAAHTKIQRPPGRMEGGCADPDLVSALTGALQALLLLGCTDDAHTLADAAMVVYDRPVRNCVRIVLAEILLEEGKAAQAYEHMRTVCVHWPSSLLVWNLYARVAAAVGSAGHGLKFLTPLRQKNPASVPIMLNMAHCCAIQGYYPRAVSELFQAMRLMPARHKPLPLLCLAITFLNQALGKRVQDKAATLLHAFALMEEYRRQRGNEQEAAYNMGRAAHQLGIMHLALEFYQRALASPPPAPGVGVLGRGKRGQPASSLDLSREAAHNIALIYRASGADEMARQVLRKHFTV